MTNYNKTRIVCAAIALILFWISYIIISVLLIETAKAVPEYEARDMYPEIPQCDKELWLRIKDGC
jgi:uncharacterized protein YsxB (DUF464 family)